MHRAPCCLLLAVLLAASTACSRQPADSGAVAAASATTPAAQRIRADVQALADDAMQGRLTGTPGFELAARHVAAEFARIGLQPAGDDGTWFQQVPLLRAVRELEGAALVIERDGGSIALVPVQDFLPGLNYDRPEHSLRAAASFVGHGVHAPELGHDDFASVQVRGRIAVVLSGAPARFGDDQRAFHSSTSHKLRMLAERGAVGAVLLNSAGHESRTPWSRVAQSAGMPGMRLRGADGYGIDTFPQLQAVATAGAASTDALLAGSGHDSASLRAAGEAGTAPAFDLPGTLLLSGRTRIEPLESRNVVALLPGSDPVLAAGHVVYTAHLDHVGIGPEVDGDVIYNGALDNALGVAIMLESARALAASTPRPRRSMLFVAVTAEEQGLLGAEWFATHPTVPAASLVANINVDMPVLLAPSRDVVPIGVEHSSLKAALEAAAADVGVALSPDPAPAEVVFVRSDQFAFVRAGIPAVYLTGGIQAAQGSGIDPAAARLAFLRDCYHQPCDDLSQPIQYDDAARLARLNARIGQRVGDAEQPPRWNEGNFFGERFGQRLEP